MIFFRIFIMAMLYNHLEPFEIIPINKTNSGTFGYKQGNPVIRFDFANAEKFLLTDTLRLNLRLWINTNDPNRLNPPAFAPAPFNQGRPNNNDAAGGGDCNVLDSLSIGCQSILMHVNITSAEGATIEMVRNYNRLVSTLIPATNSYEDYVTYTPFAHGAFGQQNNSQGRACNHSRQVSMPLLCGFLMSQEPINLGMNGVQGMSIQIQLASDVFDIWGTNAAAAGGANFVVDQVTLTGKFGVPDTPAAPSTGNFPYNSWSSFYNVAHSSDTTQGYDLGLSAVISAFTNCLPLTENNNYLNDSTNTKSLMNAGGGGVYITAAASREETMMKNGVKFPYDFAVDERTEFPTGAAQYFGLTYDSQRNFYMTDSIKPYFSTNHELKSALTEAVRSNQWGWRDHLPRSVRNLATPTINAQQFGYGVRYDGMAINATSNFAGGQWSWRLISTLDGISPNALWTFFLHKNLVNFSPQGVSVSS